MKLLKLIEITSGEPWVGLGIAGNQAGHLNQAGEARDFVHVEAEVNAPKGMFPWYFPGLDSFLGRNPISQDYINIDGGSPFQPEPEIAVVVEFHYSTNDEEIIEGVSVKGFTAFNDCSKRIEAPKISMKKNWGENSQGILDAFVSIDDFAEVGGEIDQYRLVCYLERDGQLLQYGEDTAVTDYCYFNAQLTDWITKQINTQKDGGPLEDIGVLIGRLKPQFGVIGIGATCYTEFGNSPDRFLKVGDKLFISVYNGSQYTKEDLEVILKGEAPYPLNDQLLILSQTAVLL